MHHRTFYRRHLPHYQPIGATFHVVTRLAGTLPESILEALQAERAALDTERLTGTALETALLAQERARFRRIENTLDSAQIGPRWLEKPDIAAIVQEAIHSRDGGVYDLIAYTIMPNHMHLIVTPLPQDDQSQQPLENIIGSLKRYTATRANNLLGRSGAFWQSESYDRVIRDGEELVRTVNYIMNNPVKAGLVDDVEAWPWTYVKGLTL